MTEFIIDWFTWGGYFGVFLLMALENIIPPIPSEAIMGLGAIAVARGEMSLIPLILWGTAGTTIGNVFWYEIGRRLGIVRFRPFVNRYSRWLTMDWHDVERLDRFFHRHGHWVLFVFRFLPTFRTLISLPAGMSRMPMWKFLLFTFVGSAIWNAALAGGTLALALHFEGLTKYIGPALIVGSILLLGAYVYRVVTWKPREDAEG